MFGSLSGRFPLNSIEAETLFSERIDLVIDE